ncbi:hypothetical protein Tco_1225577, partial [Tanacetum coccineum]
DFLDASHIKYALIKNPTIYVSFIKQFWRIATANTRTNGEVKLTATIDGHAKTITEASLRRHIKLEDNDGVTSLPNSEIFEQLALMGYDTDSDKLTFQNRNFSPQWRTYNFSKMIFDAMVKNVESPHKFLMYPRFIQICLDMQKKHLQPHNRTYAAHSLTNKVFSNLNRVSRGYSGVEVPLFPTMLTALESSSSRITSSPSISPEPSLSPQHKPTSTPSTSQPQTTQPIPTAEEVIPSPHESPLHGVHSLGRDEGSLSLNKLTVLCTTLSNKVAGLESELKQTKQIYSIALTKFILRVKKLEKTIKTSKVRRRARIVLSEDEDDADAEIQEKSSDDTELVLQEDEPTDLVEDQGSGEKGEKEVTTPTNFQTYARQKRGVSTGSGGVSTASRQVSTAAAEKAKEKGKGIMIEPEPPKKLKKSVQVQLTIDEELARKIQEEDQARAIAEQEQERLNLEAVLEIQRQFDERQEVLVGPTQTQSIDWNDPSVLRYHALKNKPVFVTQARKNMITFLKNQGGYKLSDFKKMSYDDIRPIFEKQEDIVAEQVELESFKKVGGSRRKTLDRKRAGEKKSADSVKRQKLQEAEVYEKEKEE